MKSYTIKDYITAQCHHFMEAPLTMGAVHGLTGGQICDTGCIDFNHGRCEAYRRLTDWRNDRVKPPTPPETVRAEARRRGVSIKQVRRERRDGR